MTPEQYKQAALRTENTPKFICITELRLDQATDGKPTQEQRDAARAMDHRLSRVMHAMMGMVTELGELMDPVKKHLIYGKPLDLPNLGEEIGDGNWYSSGVLCDALEMRLEDIWERNIAKLRVRFPDKFTEEQALNRDLDAERKALEAKPDQMVKPSEKCLNLEVPSDLPGLLRFISTLHFVDLSLATGRDIRVACRSAATALEAKPTEG